MKKQNLKLSFVSLALSVVSFVSAMPQAHAGGGENLVEFVKSKFSSPTLEKNVLDWYSQPGEKARIFTELDLNQYISIVSQDGALKFLSCGCGNAAENIAPICSDILPPYYSFTPDELLTKTTGLKQMWHTGEQIGIGAIFLAAASFPVGGEAAALFGAAGFVGASLKPNDTLQQAVTNHHLVTTSIAFSTKALHDQTDPIARVETSGDYNWIVRNFQNFLLSAKNQSKEQKAKLALAKSEYHSAKNGPGLNDDSGDQTLDCRDQMILDLKKQLQMTVRDMRDEFKSELDEIRDAVRKQQPQQADDNSNIPELLRPLH